MSRADAKANGDSLQASTINAFDALAAVPDDEAEWHDAKTVALLTPANDLRFQSTCVLERGTEVEIKACQYKIGNGSNKTRTGRWYIKKRAHERLLAVGGAYLLLVYTGNKQDEDDVLTVHERVVIPASIVDELITTWSNPGDGRDEQAVARVPWPYVLPQDSVQAAVADGGDDE